MYKTAFETKAALTFASQFKTVFTTRETNPRTRARTTTGTTRISTTNSNVNVRTTTVLRLETALDIHIRSLVWNAKYISW
jgi:biotin synthase-like enzyme